jgi:uncharacterized protein with NRDE domain
MCLVLVAVDPRGDIPIVVAANRDERHERPAQALDWWSDRPGILGGRDRVAGGTWFGAGADGRFATVLNDHRVPAPAGAPSRGELVPAFLETPRPQGWMRELAEQRARYAGFHLLAGGGSTGLQYCASVATAPSPIGPGLHTIDNAGLDIDDPRSERARDRLGPLLAAGEPKAILAGLGDHAPPGAGAGDRRPIFIRDPVFGTRCSTVLRIDAAGFATCHERRFDAFGEVAGEDIVSWRAARPTVISCAD